MSLFWFASVFSALCLGTLRVTAFDNSRTDNLAVYWGQNSYGATHLNDPANWQHNIGYYCQDDTIDVIPIAFLHIFTSTGGYPSINLANICNTDGNGVFPGTSMPNCTFLQSDIEYCQSRGKIVTISLGGATGAASFTSAAQARAFGDTIWNVFLGGNSAVRPFGGAVLDGIDLDIEGGSTIYFDSFVNRVRELASGANKQYYVTAAPQCPYPDAYLGTVLNLVPFDAVYVQFYNNWCGLQNYNNIWAWDYSSWDTWAKTVSVNPNVKIYIGAPASSTAAGSGYVDASTLANIALETRSQYSSFGGVMLWDASQAYANNRYDAQIKNAIRVGGGGSTSATSSSTRSSTTTTRSSTTSGSATSGTSTRTSSATSGTSTSQSTTTSGSATRTTSTSGTATTSRSSTTTSRSATTSTRASTTSTRASTTTTRGSTTSTRASTTSTRASTTSTRSTSTTSSRATSTSRTTTATTGGSGTSTTSSAAPTSTSGGGCSGANAWMTGTVYVGGDQVSYNGHLWTAKWWSYNDVPGGPAGVWSDNGPC